MLCTILGSVVALAFAYMLIIGAWENRRTLIDYLLGGVAVGLIVLFLCFFPPTSPYARHFIKSRLDKIAAVWSEFADAATRAAQEK